MRAEDKMLFACTRQNFLETHQRIVLDICRNEDIRWDVVYSTADLHGVAPLIYANLLRCGDKNLQVPEDILNQFELSYYRNIAMKEMLADKMVEVLSLLNVKSIDAMLIKGAALDVLVYDHPWYTVSDDVDLILRPRRAEIPEPDHAEMIARLQGLRFWDGHFQRRNVIEWDYFEHHDVNMNGVLPVNFQRIWDDAIKIKLRGKDVLVMSPEDLLLSACINSCRKRFFRLESLCHIAEIVNKYRGLNWEIFTAKAKEYQCNNIIYTALLVTQATLGCDLPEEVLDNLAVSPVRARIVHLLVLYLSRHTSLSSAFPFSARNRFGRKISAELLLTYATYRWNQIGRKTKLVYRQLRNGPEE